MTDMPTEKIMMSPKPFMLYKELSVGVYCSSAHTSPFLPLDVLHVIALSTLLIAVMICISFGHSCVITSKQSISCAVSLWLEISPRSVGLLVRYRGGLAMSTTFGQQSLTSVYTFHYCAHCKMDH